MCTILIGAVIGMIISIYQHFNDFGFDWKDIEDYVSALILSFFGILLGGFVGLAVAVILPMNFTTKVWSVDLVSIQDNNGLHGSFFLGSGQIDNRMKYVFYYKNTDSTYRMGQHDFDDCDIKYVETMPREIITSHYPDNSLWNKFALDISGSWDKYLFEIPKGSIKNNFQLDAQ